MSALLGGGGSGSGSRTVLTVDTDYYVNGTTGNDTTGTGTLASPWATIQHAVNFVMYSVTGEGVRVTIHVADGTYHEFILLGPHQIFAPNNNFQAPRIVFSTVAANLTIAPTSAAPSSILGVFNTINSLWEISGSFTVTQGGGNDGVFKAYNGGQLRIDQQANVVFSNDPGIVFDCEFDSSTSFGTDQLGSMTFQSTVGTMVVADQDATVDIYPGNVITFSIDPGFNGTFNGMWDLSYGGGCRVTCRATYAGFTAAAPKKSLITHGNIVYDLHDFMTTANVTIDIGSRYNGFVGATIIDFDENVFVTSQTPSASAWTLTLPANAGTNLYVLQTDGSGSTSWVPQSGGSGPAGSDTYVQYNNSAAFGADANLTWNKTETLTVNNVIKSTTDQLFLQQTGSAAGTTQLQLINGAGAAGAIFANFGIDLVDFGFYPSSGAQANVRFEHRTGSVLVPANDPGVGGFGEFEFVFNSLGSGIFSFALGADGMLYDDSSAARLLDYNVTNAGQWYFGKFPVLPSSTIAAFPTVTGTVGWVTDGDGALAWGATATNSGAGATKYLCWYNGTNVTVVGK